MDSSFDISFNATALLEDHQLDTTDLLFDQDEDFLPKSPVKKSVPVKKTMPMQKMPRQSLSSISLPDLPCSFQQSPSAELFQMTHHLRSEQNLHNDKIRKLLQSLQGENGDFELDDQLRTRVFRARAARPHSFDSLDVSLDSYLRDPDSDSLSPSKRRKSGRTPLNRSNEDKENSTPVLEPSKRKLGDSVRKPPLKKSKSYSAIPLLNSTRSDDYVNSGSSGTLGDLVPGLQDVRFSPQRVCVPRAVSIPSRASLKAREDLRIFLVDSSTGSLADATKFGTELNASNCEGFPLPDNPTEVVQIPTNETTPASKAQKMAIIKAVMGKNRLFDTSISSSAHEGFYSKRQFDDRRKKRMPEVEVFPDTQKRVRWADELEW